jgi:hypothetical protein
MKPLSPATAKRLQTLAEIAALRGGDRFNITRLEGFCDKRELPLAEIGSRLRDGHFGTEEEQATGVRTTGECSECLTI